MKQILSMVLVLVVTIKRGLFADVEVHAGIYFFAASVPASMAASMLMNRRVHQQAEMLSMVNPGNIVP